MSVFKHGEGDRALKTIQLRDISSEQKTLALQRAATQKFRALTHLLPVGIIQLNTAWECVYANDHWYDLSNFTRAQSIDKGWVGAFHADDLPRVMAIFQGDRDACSCTRVEARLAAPRYNVEIAVIAAL